jgi:hypothetical protein
MTSDILQMAGIAKFIKSIKLRRHGHTEQINSDERMPKGTSTPRMEKQGKEEDHRRERLMRLKKI